VVVYQDAVVLC